MPPKGKPRTQYRLPLTEAVERRCPECEETKPLAEFHRNKTSPDGRQVYCKRCIRNKYRRSPEYRAKVAEYQARRLATHEGREMHRAAQRRAHYKRRYGITPDDYDRLLAEQSGGCAICGRTEGNKVGRNTGEPKNGSRLCVDHDHETGEVRGLLCQICNLTIGHLDRGDFTLDALAAYLDRWKMS